MGRRVLAPLIVLALATPSGALQQNPFPGPAIDNPRSSASWRTSTPM